jgi:hypothetical protein
MEYSLAAILDILLYCMFLFLFTGTLILGFIQPMAAAQFLTPLLPVFGALAGIWLIVHLWPLVLSVLTDIFTFIVVNFVALLGAISAFIVGIGEAALASLQAWASAQLSVVLTTALAWIELVAQALGLGTGATIRATISLLGTTISLLGATISLLGDIVIVIGYGFGTVVVVLLNLIAMTASTLVIVVGAGSTLGMLAGGAAALVALPYIVRLLLALISHGIHLASLLALRVTFPIWKSSWLLGWAAKMLVACAALAFYLERSVRPTISLNWDGQQWAVALMPKGGAPCKKVAPEE